jgi:phosphohistidine phosphatase
MKILYLLRHGHAENKINDPDVTRDLDDQGREEARSTAEKMLKAQINPGLIISSHANRAYQTAEIAASILGYNTKNIEMEKGIYEQDTEALQEMLERQDDKYHSIIVAGHNPTLSSFAQILCKDFKSSIPTAGLVALEISANSWDTFTEGEIKLLFTIVPAAGV